MRDRMGGMNRMRQKHTISGKILLLMLLISSAGTFAMIMIGTVFLQNQVEDVTFAKDQKEKTYDFYYALIVKDTSDPFWKSVYEEAKEVGKQHNIYVEFLGEDLLEDYSVIDKFKIALASNVDGIMIMPEGEDIEALLDEAAKKEIPVVTLLNDSIKGERECFIGVNSRDIINLYWQEIENIEIEVNKVLIFMDEEEPVSGINRMYLSLKEVIEAHGIEVEVRPIDRKNAFSAEEKIRNIILSSEMTPDVMICLNMDDTLCAYQAMIDYNEVGKLAIMGYYQSETLLEGISKGIIQSTLAIDTKKMGSQAVEALYQYQTNNWVDRYFSVDVTMINQSNVKDYLLAD